MSETKKNASDYPYILYGMHFEPGVAEYQDPGTGKPYRLLVSERVAKEMDPSMARKPVHVQHMGAEDKDFEVLEDIADGYVIESFYNPPDGKHWVKFMIITDAGMQAYKDGWKLSNAWDPIEKSAGGEWHGVKYDYEVMVGDYRHLAMVPNPRYEASIILTPEQFKKYNEDKVAELATLKNSKEESHEMKLPKIFSFTSTDDKETAKIMNTMVELPTKKKMVTVAELVNDADTETKEADPKHTVKMKDGSIINVEELMKRHDEKDSAYNGLAAEHKTLMDEIEKAGEDADTKNDDDDDDAKLENESDEDYAERMKKKKNSKKNAAETEEEKTAREKKENEKKVNDAAHKNSADKVAEIRKKVAAIRNARPNHAEGSFIDESSQIQVDTAEDQLKRGKEMF